MKTLLEILMENEDRIFTDGEKEWTGYNLENDIRMNDAEYLNREACVTESGEIKIMGKNGLDDSGYCIK